VVVGDCCQSPERKRRVRVTTSHSLPSPLTITSLLPWQIALTLLGLAVLLVVPMLALVLSPANPPLPAELAGSAVGWL